MRQAKKEPRGEDAVKRLLERHAAITDALDGLQRKKFECEKRRDEAAMRLRMGSIDPDKLWKLYAADPDKAVAYVDQEMAAMEAEADKLSAEIADKLSAAEQAVADVQSALTEAASG